MNNSDRNQNVILGLWPMAGITSSGVSEQDSLETIEAAMQHGIRWFDTAFSYGFDGESDRYLGKCIGGRRDEVGVIGKAGQRWSPDRQRVIDCSAGTLIADAEKSLNRIGIEYFDLFMLHAIDPKVDLRESAEAMAEIKRRGLSKDVGICNVDLQQLKTFTNIVHPSAIQLPLNLLQREILQDLVPFCRSHDIALHVYWVLMKGILAGKISRHHRFPEGDSRPKYEIYKGEQRERTHRIVDRLSQIASDEKMTVAQLSIGWAISQPGISAALVGAKRPDQINETAASSPLAAHVLEKIEEACNV